MAEIRVQTFPMPAEFKSAMSENELLKIADLAEDKTVLECGAEWGVSTIVMAKTAKQVYSVDWQKGDPSTGWRAGEYVEYQGERISMWEFMAVGWLHNLYRAEVMEKVVPIVGAFADVIPMFRSFQFDMIFLDGDHRQEAVERDIDLILPMLRGNGTFAFHDYGRVSAKGFPDRKFGVTEPVQALARRWDVPVQTCETVAWLVRPEPR